MSNGIKFTFLLSVILIVMFSMTFAQGVPFQAEVTVSVARMRWGPGPAYVVQHYANLGHVLTVLEADAESDPPWTWYYARTPSGVESWIRGDLIRRTDAPVPVVRVDAPTGTYPVADNNLCNTTLFRPCQDGTDHDLWEAGYWANDRYDHWEHGGWNLDIVYHQNQCKLNRLCTTREAWDAARVEAELLAVTATPEVTLTPFGIEVTVEVEVPTVWTNLTADEAKQVLQHISYHPPKTPDNVYTPPAELKTTADGSIFGAFRFDRESVTVTCQYWYRTGSGALIKSRVFRVDLNKLPEDPNVDGDENDRSQVKCRSRSGSEYAEEDDVVARRWAITLNRSYSGRGQIRSVSWRLTATNGPAKTDECTRQAPLCIRDLDEQIRMYLVYFQDDERQKPEALPGKFIVTVTDDCNGQKSSSGDESRPVTRYEHTCERDLTENVKSELKFSFTHDETRGNLQPDT